MSTPADQNLVVGLDIGGTRIKCGIYNVATHEVLSSDVAPTPREEAAFSPLFPILFQSRRHRLASLMLLVFLLAAMCLPMAP